MSSQKAKRLCPHLIFVPGRMEVYKSVSRRIHEIFHEYTDIIEPLSLDEAFLDVTENKAGIFLAVDIAKEIKKRIRGELNLVASAGVSYNKFLAKIASDYRKPDGLCTIHPDQAMNFIGALPIESFWGVGPVTAKKMHTLGIHNGLQLRMCSLDMLVRQFGKVGALYYDFARGVDLRPHELEQELKILLLPKDPNDDKNVMVEIRAGAGGDEAALFASELYRMYVRYAERQRWKTEIVSLNENGIGGFKEVVFMVTGQGAYSKLKYESGVHRVQRVPETESGGRIHTSTATVAVMPEAEDVDIEIDMNDCRIDVMRASGNGGQCVNTTDSAVRLTHMPTGIVIYSQTEKSQLQNKEKAFRLLRSKLYDLELERRQNEESEARRSQIGTGDRSEKIRTYNFPQGRVTEHRIKLTLYKIDSVMDGDLDELIDSLIAADQAAKLAKLNEEI